MDFECFSHCKVTVCQNECKARYKGKKRLYLKERVFSMFMNVLRTKRLRECKEPYMEKQNDLTKTCIFGVFELVMYQNSKAHAKHPL